LLNFVYQVFFRVAFAVFILIQIILTALCAGFIAWLWPSPHLGTLWMLLWFAGIALIGAESYFVFERIRRKEWIYHESKKWLAERQRPNPQQTKRRRAIKKFVLWVPTVTVVLTCIFFDRAWALASHLIDRSSGRLIGYEVSIPLNWALYDLYHNHDSAHAIVIACRYRGLLRAGSGLYVGRRPPFSVSTMDFRTAPAVVPDNRDGRIRTKIISTRTLPFANGAITCNEHVPFDSIVATRTAQCFTSSGDFLASFSGNDEDAAEFYRILQNIKKR
jgi:hypothetical protein